MIIDSIEHVMLPTESQVAQLDEAGVNQAVLFTTTPHPERAATATFKDIESEMTVLYKILGATMDVATRSSQMVGIIEEMRRAMDAYPDRFPAAFGPVPLGLDQPHTHEWVERHVLTNGFVELGEFTPGDDEQMRDIEIVATVSEECGGLPLWVHTFTPVTRRGIRTLGDIARRHPHVPIIFGHGGGYSWMDTVAIVRDHKNAWFDLSAVFSPLSARVAMNEVPERCLFGTDAPYGDPVLSRALIERTSPSDAVTEAVLGTNVQRLLKI